MHLPILFNTELQTLANMPERHCSTAIRNCIIAVPIQPARAGFVRSDFADVVVFAAALPRLVRCTPAHIRAKPSVTSPYVLGHVTRRC
eukprot:428964-Rhodomonas_salina.1